jgi:hydroxypyruvate isomerase
MNRRDFARKLPAAAVGTYGLTRTVLNASSAFEAKKEAKKTESAEPIRLSVMLWTVFTNLPFEQRLEKVAEAGYRNVQLVGEYQKWNDEDFAHAEAKRKVLSLTFDATAGLKHSLTNPADREGIVAEFRNALAAMERISCPSMIVLSGNRVPDMTREAQRQSCIDGLKAMAAIAEGKFINGETVRLLLETIDPEENPKYFLTEILGALEVVKAVNHPQVQLLYDFYHQQIAGGNLIAKLEKCIPNLALVHIADVPGRHEPGTGEINYANIFRKLGELNYKGTVAMEFRPSGDPVNQLRAARQMALDAYASGRSETTA